LNDLNFHLHHLDSFASATRVALKKLEQSNGKGYGNDCIAANLILQINKFRYKNNKGDPHAFISFLEKIILDAVSYPDTEVTGFMYFMS